MIRLVISPNEVNWESLVLARRVTRSWSELGPFPLDLGKEMARQEWPEAL